MTNTFRYFKKVIYYICGKRILAGPFRGMKYIENSHGSAYLPKILGSYEKELHKFIPRIVEEEYELILDIGAAEGYYAVGLSYLYKKNVKNGFQVITYDSNLDSFSSLKKLATLNNVIDHIIIKNLCNHKILNSLPNKKTFILCDIEGSETYLLNPKKAPKLYNIDMLIELHDGNNSYILNKFLKRFQESHNIEVIHFTKRKVYEAPWWLIHPKLKINAVREGRKNGLKWLYLKTKFNF